MTPDLVFVSGLLSGLAASLHCAGLCGGIAAMLMPALPGGGALSARIRLSFLAKMQAGRAAVYVAAGTAAGGLGYAMSGLLALGGLQDILRWLAAMLIVLTGLSIAGVLPPMRRLDRHAKLLGGLRTLQARSAFGFGAMLALAPCAMVLNALLTATLMGTPASGGLYMTGFSLAALPGVILSAFGISGLTALGQDERRRMRLAAGLGLAAVGMLSALLPQASLSQICFG